MINFKDYTDIITWTLSSKDFRNPPSCIYFIHDDIFYIDDSISKRQYIDTTSVIFNKKTHLKDDRHLVLK